MLRKVADVAALNERVEAQQRRVLVLDGARGEGLLSEVGVEGVAKHQGPAAKPHEPRPLFHHEPAATQLGERSAAAAFAQQVRAEVR